MRNTLRLLNDQVKGTLREHIALMEPIGASYIRLPKILHYSIKGKIKRTDMGWDVDSIYKYLEMAGRPSYDSILGELRRL